MSTAVMSSSTLYDFGDLLYKSHAANNTNNNRNNNNNNNNSNRATATTTATNINMSSSLHQKVLRWGSDSSQRAVGGPVPLGRRSSNPGSSSTTATIAVTASLVSSVSTLILDNMRSDASAAAAVVHRKLDRSQSEPPTASAAAVVKAANINTSRYKTELCRPFEENGSCKYGDKCQFAHGVHELRNLVRHPKYKTELCRTFHTIGFCPYGPRCHFIHNADEARNKPKPLELTGSSPGAAEMSPTSSLSQSPTNSVGSFFSENDVFSSLSPQPQPLTPNPVSANTAFAFGQDFHPLPVAVKSVSPSPPVSPRGSPPPATEARLPVFNRLSSQLILSGFNELLA